MHPMNYFFIACGFFSFNLVFSYLVDHLDLKYSFLVASVTSYFLVVTYLRLVVGTKFALVDAGLSQLLFQIAFAFAHFHEGYTGISITAIAVVTLGICMRLTAKIDWEEKFKSDNGGKGKKQKPENPLPASLSPEGLVPEGPGWLPEK
jgi:inner membrane protein involved in colicin E2 resistance